MAKKKHVFTLMIGKTECEEDYTDEQLSQWKGNTPIEKYKDMLRWFNKTKRDNEEERVFVRHRIELVNEREEESFGVDDEWDWEDEDE